MERLLTTMPSLSNSPRMRSAPHKGLSRAMVAIKRFRWWNSSTESARQLRSGASSGSTSSIEGDHTRASSAVAAPSAAARSAAPSAGASL